MRSSSPLRSQATSTKSFLSCFEMEGNFLAYFVHLITNAVIEGACERVIVGDMFCDIPLGLYIIRGENVVLIGELDPEKEELPAHMTCVSAQEIRKAQKAEREATDLKGSMRKRMEFLDLE